MKPLAEQSLYEVLEVEPGASAAIIRTSYERLRKLLGPGSLAMYSLVEPAEAHAMLLRIDEAWAILSDDAQRRRYDASIGLLPAAPEAPASNSFKDAVAAIGLAGGGALPPAQAVDEPPEIALDEDDLLEVVEIGAPGILVARVAGSEIREDERVWGGIAPVLEEDAGAEILSADEIGAEPIAPAGSEASVDAPPPEDPLPPIGAETVFTGALLRRIRIARGLSLEELARRTRIGAGHFANLEEERWHDLPERVFLRGYLVAYAQELRLDAVQVCNSYLARSPGERRR